MGHGILGPQIASIPFGDGTAIKLKDASSVPGVTCEIHDLVAAEVARMFIELMKRPGGLDACPACIERVTAFAKARRAAR